MPATIGSRRFVTAVVLVVGGCLSTRAAAACSCVPPPLPKSGSHPPLRVPSVTEHGAGIFVATVKDVFPKDFSDYQARWRVYCERLIGEDPPPVEELRTFILGLWPKLFSARETQNMQAAKTVAELNAAVRGFWLTPRRIRLNIEESFAGPSSGALEVYTGLDSGDCGVDFAVGGRWFIDSYLDAEGRWIAHLCSVTLPIEKATAVLSRLRAER